VRHDRNHDAFGESLGKQKADDTSDGRPVYGRAC
jgi:hypothetical protein